MAILRLPYKYFCNMNDLLCFFLPVQSAHDVHETTRIGDYERGGICRFEVGYLSLQPLRR